MGSRLQAVQGDWLGTCCWCSLVNSREWWLIAHTFLYINNFLDTQSELVVYGPKRIYFPLFFFQEEHHVSHISNQGRNCKRKYLVIWNRPREKLTFVGRTPAFIQMDWWEKQTRLISLFDDEMWQVTLSHDSLNLLSRYHLMPFEEFWESGIPKFSHWILFYSSFCME